MALREDTRHWWEDVLAHDPDELEEDQGPYTADAAGLLRFLEGEILPWYAMRPLICAQVFGEALDPERLERLGRYEVHLDRKLERMLTNTDPVAKPAADRRPRLIRCAKLLPARVFLAEPYAGEQGQRGGVRLEFPGCHP